MYGFMSDPEPARAEHGGAGGQQRVAGGGRGGGRQETSRRPPIVYCGVGDGTTQQGEFLEACAEAVRSRLAGPVCGPKQPLGHLHADRRADVLLAAGRGRPTRLFGMPIQFRGRAARGRAYDEVRRGRRGDAAQRRPAAGRAATSNGWAATRMRTTNPSTAAPTTLPRPPGGRSHSDLRSGGCWNTAGAKQSWRKCGSKRKTAVAQADEEAVAGAEPEPTFEAKRPLKVELTHPSRERRGTSDGLQLIMRDAIREVLRDHLRDDERVLLFGEDIEDPKGDVFGVTRGLSTEFPGRVMNSALTESTIVGTCDRPGPGRPAAGGVHPVRRLPAAGLQPDGLGTGQLYWRTAGQWNAPVIVMVACGGYRPGLGPYHAQTFESVVAHTPGLDVFMPSTASDAAGLLNAAFESERPTVLFYPKSMLNNPELTTSADVDRQFVPIGTARKVRAGRDITLVGWGNTVLLCARVAAALEKAGVEAEVLDLRCISPWDQAAVLASAEKTARLIVVHEDNQTCGLGGEVLATVAQRTRVPVAMRRVTRPDTHIPCNFANQIEVMPSFQRVLTTAAELLNLELSWIPPPKAEAGVHVVEAIGSGPSDDTVMVVELMVQPGDAGRTRRSAGLAGSDQERLRVDLARRPA